MNPPLHPPGEQRPSELEKSIVPSPFPELDSLLNRLAMAKAAAQAEVELARQERIKAAQIRRDLRRAAELARAVRVQAKADLLRAQEELKRLREIEQKLPWKWPQLSRDHQAEDESCAA